MKIFKFCRKIVIKSNSRQGIRHMLSDLDDVLVITVYYVLHDNSSPSHVSNWFDDTTIFRVTWSYYQSYYLKLCDTTPPHHLSSQVMTPYQALSLNITYSYVMQKLTKWESESHPRASSITPRIMAFTHK